MVYITDIRTTLCTASNFYKISQDGMGRNCVGVWDQQVERRIFSTSSSLEVWYVCVSVVWRICWWWWWWVVTMPKKTHPRYRQGNRLVSTIWGRPVNLHLLMMRSIWWKIGRCGVSWSSRLDLREGISQVKECQFPINLCSWGMHSSGLFISKVETDATQNLQRLSLIVSGKTRERKTRRLNLWRWELYGYRPRLSYRRAWWWWYWMAGIGV